MTPRRRGWGPFALVLLLAGGLQAGAEPPLEPPADPAPASEEASEPAQPAIAPLQAAWSGAAGLEERVRRTRRAADELGVASLDTPARALLLDTAAGSALARAEGAARLAPALPAAQAALARARLLEARDPSGAARAALAALRAVPGHLDASLWFGANALTLLVWVLSGAGLAFVALCALGCLAHAAHDLGDGLQGETPGFARAALLGALLLAPATLGEGVLGVAVALFVVAFCYARASRRIALVVAAGLVTLGLHPTAEWAARFLAAPGADPVADAAYAAEHGSASALDLLRLERAGDSESLARAALALQAKRSGSLAEADRRYGALAASGVALPPAVLNNAANVRLRLGDAPGAIALLERAAAESDSALIWFNLSQAYGRAIQVDAHERALARAQSLDEDAVRELTARLSEAETGFLTDVPLPAAAVRGRLLAAAARSADGSALRRPLAPGRLGADPRWTGGAFAAALGLALVLSVGFGRSRGCARCGVRLCPRCRSHARARDLCEGCERLVHRPDTVDPARRGQHLAMLRRRAQRRARLAALAAWLVPGAAGLLAGRPLHALAALLAFTGALAAVLGRSGVVSDPLAVGAVGPACFAAAAAGLALLYGALVLRVRPSPRRRTA